MDKPDSKLSWFCLRSNLKHERIAAAHLQRQNIPDVFVPTIRFKRKTRYGPVWVTEALFPNYLFARFDWTASLRQVHYSPGISEIVHFGHHWPVIPDEVINQLRATLGTNEVHVIETEMVPGDAVQIAGGLFHDLRAVVTQVMPGRNRVAVLLDFLGSQTPVEIDPAMLVREADERSLLLG